MFLENLDILDTLLRTTPLVDADPLLNDTLDVWDAQARESKIVAGMEDDDIAAAVDGFRGKQGVRVRGGSGDGRRSRTEG